MTNDQQPTPLHPANVPSAPSSSNHKLHYSLEAKPNVFAHSLRKWLKPGALGFYALLMICLIVCVRKGWEWRVNADRVEFENAYFINDEGDYSLLHLPPTSASLRHLSRSHISTVLLAWGDSDPDASARLRGRSFPYIRKIDFDCVDNDKWVAEISRPDTGFTNLKQVKLRNDATDRSLIEISRSDTGLSRVNELEVQSDRITDLGILALMRSDSGLHSLRWLSIESSGITDQTIQLLIRDSTHTSQLQSLALVSPNITDEGLKLLANPDVHIYGMISLYIRPGEHASDEVIQSVRKSHPGWTIER